MAIKFVKPTTNGRRNINFIDRSHLHKGKAEKSLLVSQKNKSGRSGGTITIRHRGGGNKTLLRKVDFKGVDKLGISGKVTALEYDPARSAFIGLVAYKDGEKRYVLAHKDMKVGDEVITDTKAKALTGNRMQLEHIPVGFQIYNVEITPNRGGQVARSAGSSATLTSLDGDMAQVQLHSGEIRFVDKINFATIGVVSNEDHSLLRIGKAGRVRHKGRRPVVRGKAMNPCDHPHGGGEGNTPIGMKYPKTPWGAHALGVKTRKRTKASNKFIVRSRHRAKKI
ncbi:MAG TPA: 50S ribosomal protein L2 [Candidatus Gracilibacteria bacterium]